MYLWRISLFPLAQFIEKPAKILLDLEAKFFLGMVHVDIGDVGGKSIDINR